MLPVQTAALDPTTPPADAFRRTSTCRRPFWEGSGETLRLALPLMAAQVSVVAMALADTATFGLIGTAALAGGGLGALVFTYVNITASGVLTATAIQVAYASAERREALAGIMRAGLFMALLIGIPASVLVARAGPLLIDFGQETEAVRGATAFLTCAAPAILVTLIFTALRGLAVGLGDARPVGTYTVVGLLLKVLLNAAILVGLRALPAGDHTIVALRLLGVADTLVCATSTALLWRHCRRRFGQHLGLPRLATPTTPAFREALRLGLPIGLSFGIEAGLFDGVGLIVGRFGAIALAANAIALQCISLTFMLAVGLSQAATVRVGRAAGAGDLVEARRVGHQVLVLGLAIMTGSAILFGFGGKAIATALAGDATPAVATLAARLLVVAAFFQVFDGTQNIAVGALRGLKETRLPVIAALFGYWVVGLPSAWLLATTTRFGPAGAWVGIGLGLATAAAMLVIRFEGTTAARRRPFFRR